MKLPFSLAMAAVLAAGSLFPAAAEAKSKSKHNDDHKHHHHHDHGPKYRTIKVWVHGHSVWRHGHRHYIPGHFEYRRVAYY